MCCMKKKLHNFVEFGLKVCAFGAVVFSFCLLWYALDVFINI